MLTAAARETPDIETASDSYARRFSGAAGRYLLAEQEAAVVAALGEWRGGSVLDVGGGHAQLTPLLQRRAAAVTVLGSDARSLFRVQREYPGCPAVVGNLLELPFESRSFDVVMAVRLLPHVVSWQQLLAEMCRVARSAVIVDYPRIAGFNSLTPLLFPLKKKLEGNTRHYRNFRDAEVDDVLRACNFAPTQRHAQFVLPMVVHRHANGALRAVEQLFKSLRVTAAHGSPVVLRADRRQQG